MSRNPWKKLLGNTKISGRAGRALGKNQHFDDHYPCYPINITWEDLEYQFDKQQGKCYWTGITLIPDDIFIPFNQLAMSVDRIDNDRGYDRDNIVISCRMMNIGRGKASHDEFRQILRLLRESLNSYHTDFN